MKSTFPKHPFSYNAKEAGIFISNSVQYHWGAERAHVLRALALLPWWYPENEIEGNRFLLSPAVGALSKCLLCYRDWVWASETQQLLFSCVWLSVTPWTVARQTLHGISQARILEWFAMPFSRGSSPPRDRTCVSCTAGRFFTTEPPGKPARDSDMSTQTKLSPH